VSAWYVPPGDGVTIFEGPDGVPGPALLVAVTVNECGVHDRPAITACVDVPGTVRVAPTEELTV
jgi:hypothetical protein